MDIETGWAITAAVVPVALSIGIGLMALTGRERIAICFLLFSALWLGIIAFMWLIHTPSSLPYRILAGLGTGAFVFVVVPLLVREAWPAVKNREEIKMSQSSDNTPPFKAGPGSIITFGQSGNNTIYNGDRLAELGPDAESFIKKAIPSGGKVMLIKNANDSPSAEMEKRLAKSLTDNGYQIAGSGFGVGGEYFKGISVVSTPRPDGVYTIIIGDSRAN